MRLDMMCSLLLGRLSRKRLRTLRKSSLCLGVFCLQHLTVWSRFQTLRRFRNMQFFPQCFCPNIAVSDRWLWKAKTSASSNMAGFHLSFNPFAEGVAFSEVLNMFKMFFSDFKWVFMRVLMVFVSGTILCRFFSCRTASWAPCEAPQRGVTWDGSSSALWSQD